MYWSKSRAGLPEAWVLGDMAWRSWVYPPLEIRLGERDCHLQLPGWRLVVKRKTEASQRCMAIGQKAKDVGWKEGVSGLVS